MPTDTRMRPGMAGPGRMGADLVRRLMRDGRRCVVCGGHPQKEA